MGGGQVDLEKAQPISGFGLAEAPEIAGDDGGDDGVTADRLLLEEDDGLAARGNLDVARNHRLGKDAFGSAGVTGDGGAIETDTHAVALGGNREGRGKEGFEGFAEPILMRSGDGADGDLFRIKGMPGELPGVG